MRIALVTANFLPAIGGAELVVHHLARHWHLQGHEVRVFNTSTDEATHAEAARLDGLLSIEVAERSWTAVCNGSLDSVREWIGAAGGEIESTKNASLEEIFVARVGRKYLPTEED